MASRTLDFRGLLGRRPVTFRARFCWLRHSLQLQADEAHTMDHSLSYILSSMFHRTMVLDVNYHQHFASLRLCSVQVPEQADSGAIALSASSTTLQALRLGCEAPCCHEVTTNHVYTPLSRLSVCMGSNQLHSSRLAQSPPPHGIRQHTWLRCEQPDDVIREPCPHLQLESLFNILLPLSDRVRTATCPSLSVPQGRCKRNNPITPVTRRHYVIGY